MICTSPISIVFPKSTTVLTLGFRPGPGKALEKTIIIDGVVDGGEDGGTVEVTGGYDDNKLIN